ncbi:MAG TPA: isocitrate lyase/phosphoenolpyruvate mutase family protein [Thermoanaerobaculia bacterium]|jgi:2-methylisocitrate lyase-like PEP mutase family enzyme
METWALGGGTRVKNDLHEKAERLRALHRGNRPLVLVNAWDPATARILERAGSAAIATTSAGIAFSNG